MIVRVYGEQCGISVHVYSDQGHWHSHPFRQFSFLCVRDIQNSVFELVLVNHSYPTVL